MKSLRSLLLALACLGLFALTASADTNTVKTVAKLVDVAKAEELIKDKKVIVLDVRTAAEFAGGHISGATNLDFRDKKFKELVAKLPKDKTYLVNCAAGRRSAAACELLSQMEFKTLFDLKGGMQAWEAAGKPVEKP